MEESEIRKKKKLTELQKEEKTKKVDNLFIDLKILILFKKKKNMMRSLEEQGGKNKEFLSSLQQSLVKVRRIKEMSYNAYKRR